MLRKLFSVVVLMCMAAGANAQELLCKVKVMHDKILNVDKEVFNGLERQITEFINNRKWTTDQFNVTEKIECNVLINLTKRSDDDIYEATLNIQASRPIFNSGYTSPTVNFIDRDFKFKYSQFTPITYDDNRVSGNDALASNLTAVLAYYCYLVIGLDYDSFSANGGNDYFKKAQNIVNNAPESGSTITGWKAVEGTKNRYWIIDQLLSPRFTTYRTVWYQMHRVALDNMYRAPEESRKTILEDITKLSQLQKDNPGAILIQFFFNAKSDEMMGIMGQVPKEQRANYITMLQQMDVPNAQKYAALK
ncbi:MAG: DUF4835 family protein [Sphingobacteriales bacterium]|nr:MAG: DUF4835 family protein [Sphingobacteriales bacterium]